MQKDCYSQKYVDAEKFRECATCPLFDECTRTVELAGARKAALVGQAAGLLSGLALAVGAAMRLSSSPRGAAWVIFVSLLYLVSIWAAGKEYARRNDEEREALQRKAEAK